MSGRSCWCHICAKEMSGSILPVHLEQILPEGHFHFVCSYTPLEAGFRALIKLQLGTREEAERWLEEFQRSSRVTLRIDKTFPNTEDTVRRNGYRVDMRCQHNTRNKDFTKKNTHCPAGLSIVLKKQRHSNNRKSRSRDTHIQEGLFMHVNLKHNHNHNVESAEALQKHDVSRDMTKKLEQLFKSGHSPSTALNTLEYDLQEELPSTFANRSVCLPDITFCCRLYYSLFKREYEAPSSDTVIKELRDRLKVYNDEQSETCARMESTREGQVLVALCTPLMRRIHRLERHSGDVLFMESSGGCDGMNSRVFLLLTHSAVGGLPLGVIVTTSESQGTMAMGLQLLQTILPDDAFYGRGDLGPKAVMTDDCEVLRIALRSAFPRSAPLHCVFHVLRATWRWLWDSKHGVPKVERQQLLDIFKKLLCALSPEELEALYQQALQDPAVLKHPRYLERLVALYDKRWDWAICLRAGFLTRGDNMNTFVKSAMNVWKDNVFHRLKPLNITQLVDFICTRLDAFYIRRLHHVADGLDVRREFNSSDICPDRIEKEDEWNYSITCAKGGFFVVNTSMAMCTCPAGSSGALCTHLSSVIQAFKLLGESRPPVTSFTTRMSLYEMATGQPVSWFLDLQCETEDGPTGPLSASAHEEVTAECPPSAEDSGAENTSSQTELEHLEAEFRSIVEVLMDKLKTNESFRAPIESFVSSFNRIHTDSGLISMLSKLGKTRTAPASRKSLQTNTQRAAVRRKAPLGAGASLHSRPSKRTRKDKEGGATLLSPEPLSLPFCVQKQ